MFSVLQDHGVSRSVNSFKGRKSFIKVWINKLYSGLTDGHGMGDSVEEEMLREPLILKSPCASENNFSNDIESYNMAMYSVEHKLSSENRQKLTIAESEQLVSRALATLAYTTIAILSTILICIYWHKTPSPSF